MSDEVLDPDVQLYAHGTTFRRLPGIAKYGLTAEPSLVDPNLDKAFIVSNEGCLYFTPFDSDDPDEDGAYFWGSAAARKDYDHWGWYSDSVQRENPAKHPMLACVYVVRDALDEEALQKDSHFTDGTNAREYTKSHIPIEDLFIW